MEIVKITEAFNDINDGMIDSENFPIKDRKHASIRRKKNYFKAKKRFDRFCRMTFYRHPEVEHVIHGMMRKTNPIKFYCYYYDNQHRTFDRKTIRRRAIADHKLAEYGLEDMED